MKELLLNLFCALVLSVTDLSAQDKLVFGNPSSATNKQTNPKNFLLEHQNFILSYNKSRGAANWVTWHLSRASLGLTDIGLTDNPDDFAPDELLPVDWRIKPSDYSEKVFDRGQMCPSSDRSNTLANNVETYMMSNIQPLTPNLSRVTWKSLEEFSRVLVRRGNELYIYAGCYGSNGRINDKITIATNCFKIILVLPEGNDDLNRVGVKTRVIAVDMPNKSTVNRRWQTYLTNVDAIEKVTGFDFLSPLKDELENELEARTDDGNRR
jgi:endonuclease G